MAHSIARLLTPEQARLLEAMAGAAARLGVDLFLVGGTVRDLLLERASVDLDTVAVAPPEGFAFALAGEVSGEVLGESQFGTSKLRVGDIVVDLATARRETYAHPGALPAVAAGTIDQDLARRDFSINAMAFPLSPGLRGELLDPFGGQLDLRRRLVRVLHPNSFADDATRILRAIRYSERLEFALEHSTAELLQHHLAYLDRIKGDRVRHELERIFREERAAPMLRRMRDNGVLRAIHEGLTVDDSTLAKLGDLQAGAAPGGPLVFLAAIAYSMGTAPVDGLVGRLNMDGVWTRVARDAARLSGMVVSLRQPDLRPSEIHALLSGLDERAVIGASIAASQAIVARRLSRYEAELRHVKTELTGDDLIALGVPQGPRVGALLRELLAARLDGSVTDAEGERQIVSKCLDNHNP